MDGGTGTDGRTDIGELNFSPMLLQIHLDLLRTHTSTLTRVHFPEGILQLLCGHSSFTRPCRVLSLQLPMQRLWGFAIIFPVRGRLFRHGWTGFFCTVCLSSARLVATRAGGKRSGGKWELLIDRVLIHGTLSDHLLPSVEGNRVTAHLLY